MDKTARQITATTKYGIGYSIGASVLFALIPAYLQLLPSIAGFAVIGQRVIWTTLLIALLLMFTGRLGNALQPLRNTANWPGLVAGSLLIGIQWGLFVWAPLNGETLGLAIGYFLLPLVLVLIGRLFFKEQISVFQWIAVGLAVAALAFALYNNGHFSWVALAVGLGYPLYFVLRRVQPIPVLSAFFIENVLLFPVAWWACVHYGYVDHPFAYSTVSLMQFLGLGAIGSLGMLCYLSASRKLPMVLFGLLSYLEPPLLLLVGLFAVGEAIRPGEGPTYIMISAAMAVLVLEGALTMQRENRMKQRTITIHQNI